MKGRPDHFKAGWNEELKEHVRAVWQDEYKDVMVAVRDGVICGFACVDYIELPESPYRYARKFYHVGEFGVDEAFYRQGVATELVEFMKQDAKEKGFGRIELDVWEFNESARAFYEAAGFQCSRRYLELADF